MARGEQDIGRNQDMLDAERAFGGDGRRLRAVNLGGLRLELRLSGDSLWTLVRRGKTKGALALRTHVLGEIERCTKDAEAPGEAIAYRIATSLGRYEFSLRCDDFGLEQLRLTAAFTPTDDLHVPYLPRDLY